MAVISGLCMIALFSLSGCSDEPPGLAANKVVKPPVKNVQDNTAALKAAASIQETSVQEGYIYDRRDRRDPFIPLIVPKMNLNDKETAKIGTLESYDIGEYVLAAIIKKGGGNFALVVAPDNRSFTVRVGTVIGFNKGKVEEISDERIVLVEYSKDYKGDLRPRRITMDFRKGD